MSELSQSDNFNDNLLTQLNRLAGYYRDIIAASSSRRGGHLFNLGAARSSAIVADLCSILEHWEEMLDDEELSFQLPDPDAAIVQNIVSHASEEEEREEAEASLATYQRYGDQEDGSQDSTDTNADIQKAADALLAMYRKQEQDPYDRETLLGFGVLSGTHGSLRYCSPLFFFPVHIDYDPTRRVLKLRKDTQAPGFNIYLVVNLAAEDEGAVEGVRHHVMPLLHEEFTPTTVESVQRILGDMVPALHGLTRENREIVPLSEALLEKGTDSPCIFNTCVAINARRSHTFLLDDLADLSNLDKLEKNIAVTALLASYPEVNQQTDGEEHPLGDPPKPLLFPLQSNPAQERAARKAEGRTLTVIEGPPGTGKSQTIANLVSHLIGQDKTVLVTSHQNKALEVVMDKLPQLEDDSSRDYLAMAMLKGEAESARQLAEKLTHFDATMASGSREQLEASLKIAWEQLYDNQAQARRLRARFAELKNIERDAASGNTYYRYDEIRHYDGIHPGEQIPEDTQHQAAEALGSWAETLNCLREQWQELCGLLTPLAIDGSAEHAERRARLLQELIQLCDGSEALSRDPFGPEVLDLTTTDQPRELIEFLRNLDQWLHTNGNRAISLRASLSEQGANGLGIPSAVALAGQLGEGILAPILEQALNMEDQSRGLVAEVTQGPKEVPSETDLLELEASLTRVEQSATRWVRWHWPWAIGHDLRLLERRGLGRLRYRSCSHQLAALRQWLTHWQTRYKVAAFLGRAAELGLVAQPPAPNSPLIRLHRESAQARAFTELVHLLSQAPRPDPVLAGHPPIHGIFEGLVDLQAFQRILRVLEMSIEQLDRLATLDVLRGRPELSDLWGTWCDGWAESIEKPNQKAAVIAPIEMVRRLLKHADDFVQVLKQEEGPLTSIPRTVEEARRIILSGEYPEWLHKPEVAVEAHRLCVLIHEDLKTNPDDIEEVARRLSQLQGESRNLAVAILRRQRRLALWEAAYSGRVRAEIDRLRRLLTRRRKTVSLVEVRDKIDYRAILKVFPCWVMGIDDVARIFPLEPGLFDYVIVDEASQCHQATALHLAYRAQRMVVVGDEKQLQNPLTRFLRDDQIKLSLDKHNLVNHPNVDVLDAKVSLLGLASRCCGSGREFLNEHFRSEPAIIAWSNKHFYGNRLRILTPMWPRRFEPCMEVRLVNGADDDPEGSRTNELEAKVVIQELRSLLLNPEYQGLTIGIITPFRQQADLLQHLVHTELADHPEWIRSRGLVASTADGFQGDERDVVLYSMRYGPSSRPGSITAIEMEQERMNVAFTRARRSAICFISRPVDTFPRSSRRRGSVDGESPGIRNFLEHAVREQRSPMGRLGADHGDKFDSNFEKEVCSALRSRGLTVLTQVPCAGFSIDLVVRDDEGRRLAVECDGEFHYEEGDLRPDDYQRQDIIERAGWTVFRVPFRRFYANPMAAVAGILEVLREQPSDNESVVQDLEPSRGTSQFEGPPRHDGSEIPDNVSSTEVIESRGQGNVRDTIARGDIELAAQEEPPESYDVPFGPPSDASSELGDGPVSNPSNWFAISHWGRTTGLLKPYDRGFAFNVGKYLARGWTLSPRQMRYAEEVWQNARDQGFNPDTIEIE